MSRPSPSPAAPPRAAPWRPPAGPLVGAGLLALVGAAGLLWARHGADVFGAVVASMLQACF